MSVSISHSAVEGYHAVEEYEATKGYEPVPGLAAAARPETAMFRRRSLQPSRRAVLHVQAAGDPAVPSDLGDWFTERAFHFYLAGLRLPHRVTARAGVRGLASACADLDAACAHLRQADGMGHVIVAAQGRGALAAALWSDARAGGDVGAGDYGADALVLCEPVLPARPALKLSISCPVLVVTGLVLSERGRAAGAAASRWPLRQRRPAPAAAQLGSHVTWLHLPRPGGRAELAEGAGRRLFFDELGRWLGAYMYGQLRDQLL